MTLTERDHRRLRGVDKRLVDVVELAATLTMQPFNVSEGLRTYERQLQLYKEGKSKTMKSKHLEGKAVDLYPLTDDRASVDWKGFETLAGVMKTAAELLDVKIQWGGDWRTFIDKPHFELCE